MLKIAKKFKAFIDDGYYDVNYKFSERIGIDYWTYIFTLNNAYSNGSSGTHFKLEIIYNGQTLDEMLNGDDY